MYEIKHKNAKKWIIGIEKRDNTKIEFRVLSSESIDDWALMYYNGICENLNFKDNKDF